MPKITKCTQWKFKCECFDILFVIWIKSLHVEWFSGRIFFHLHATLNDRIFSVFSSFFKVGKTILINIIYHTFL